MFYIKYLIYVIALIFLYFLKSRELLKGVTPSCQKTYLCNQKVEQIGFEVKQYHV